MTPRYEADRFRIVLLDRATGAERSLTDAFDNTIHDFAWSADSKKIFFTADVKGRTPLHELDVATGRIRVVTGVGTLDSFALSHDGSFAVVARRRIRPADGALAHRHGRRRRTRSGTRLTTHNAALEAEVDIRPAEEHFFPGADGVPVQTWIVKPHGFDPSKKYPLILNIHGGPQPQWADAFRGDWQVYPGAGYVEAFPNPHGSTGFGQAYTSAISGDWDGKVMEDVSKVTDALEKLPYVDKERIGVMGWSWGGYAVMWLVGHTARYKAAASMMGVYDLRSMYSATEELWFPEWDLKGPPWANPDGYRKQSPSTYVTNFRTPTLVLTGQHDFRVPVHAVAHVLHRPPEDERPVPPRRLGEGRALALLARDGALLRRPPRLVPPVARRRRVAVGPEGDGGRKGLGHGASGKEVRRCFPAGRRRSTRRTG